MQELPAARRRVANVAAEQDSRALARSALLPTTFRSGSFMCREPKQPMPLRWDRADARGASRC